MTKIINTYSVQVNAPLEAVFAYVIDLTRHSEWSGGPLKVEPLAPGPIGIGSLFRSWGDLPGQKNRINELRVTQYQPRERFAFIAKDPTFGDVQHEFSFMPAGTGTSIKRTVHTSMSPVMAFLHKILIHPLIGKPMMDRAMLNLKNELERRARS